ncbi:transposase [candidate division WOR-3 bacterium]|nr:transposase [candidate division WOR-3 bacterium]
MGKHNDPNMRIARPAQDNTRRNLPHLQRAGKTYFVTFSSYKRWILPKSIRHIVIEHCLHDHGLKIFLHGVVVMPDHVHMVITPLPDDLGGTYGLAEILQGIKGSSARSINKALGREGKVWQRESFDHMLRSFENAQSKVEYICLNPVRKGLVANEDDYPWLWREWVDSALT